MRLACRVSSLYFLAWGTIITVSETRFLAAEDSLFSGMVAEVAVPTPTLFSPVVGLFGMGILHTGQRVQYELRESASLSVITVGVCYASIWIPRSTD